MGLAIGLVADESLLFQNTDNRRHGVVGGFRLLHFIEDAVYDRSPPGPQYLHDFQFGPGQLLRAVLHDLYHNYKFSLSAHKHTTNILIIQLNN